MFKSNCTSIGLVRGSVVSIPSKAKILSSCCILCSTFSGFGSSARITVLGFGTAVSHSGGLVNFPASLNCKIQRSANCGSVSFRWFKSLLSSSSSGSRGSSGTFGAVVFNSRGGDRLGKEVTMSSNTAPNETCSGKATETKLRVALCQILPKLDKVC